MGMGPFAYVTFICVFLKFEGATYDLRQSIHKTMGVVSYLAILLNVMTGGGMLYLDVALFLIASYFFYRAMSENFETVAKGTLGTIVGFALLIAGMTVSAAKAEKQTSAERAKKMSETEAEMRKTLEAATKAMQGVQNQQQLER